MDMERAELEKKVTGLMDTSNLPELGDGSRGSGGGVKPDRKAMQDLLDSEDLPVAIGELLISLYLLWHDHLDASHTISQDYGHPEASYIHGMMHRREGDYGNAKYWFRRAQPLEDESAFAEDLHNIYMELGGGTSTYEFLSPTHWEPADFVDACRRDLQNDDLQIVQAAEFHAMARHLIRHA